MTTGEALSVLGISLEPLRAKCWDRKTSLRVLKIAAKKAFRYKALETHPDLHPGKDEEFKVASDARDLLASMREDDITSLLGDYEEIDPMKEMRSRGTRQVSVTLVYSLPIVGWR